MKRKIIFLICFCYLFMTIMKADITAFAASTEPELTAPSFCLMEETTGKVICERNANERRSPASITKIMTLILVFDAIKSGKITLQDEVLTSAYAKSMGGSQVFLEEGELQSVDTLIKCIAIASGNDASVAIAEHISGSEEEFVQRMNEKAAQLGLKDTAFEDCTGLTDSSGHYSSAEDVAKMSAYLIRTYPEIYNYTTIWMEDIVHKTSKGETQFTLSSTNKLLKQYPYTTGLKTGSTDKAKYCISATAKNGSLSLIAVVMGAETPVARFDEAKALLHYGFQISRFYEDKIALSKEELPVKGSVQRTVPVKAKTDFKHLDIVGIDFSKIEKEEFYSEELIAPVAVGSEVGAVHYLYEGKELGVVPIVATEEIRKAFFSDFFIYLFRQLLL